MKYYIKAFQKYVDSNGRASRRELIWFCVFHWIVCVILAFLDGFFGLLLAEGYGVLSGIYSLAAICPNMCLQIRRLHDVGKSGFWWWTVLVPFLNLYLIYLLFFKRGEPSANRYGPPVSHEESQSHMSQQDKGFYTSPLPAGETTNGRFCRYCGAKLSEDSRFCRMCGAEVPEK